MKLTGKVNPHNNHKTKIMTTQLIKTVIVDDEDPSRKALSNYLREFCPNIQVVAECGSAKTAFKAINEKQPQLVFLDIEMPKGSGFDLLRMFDTINFKVIFITAFSNYAVQAFRVSATDFLLKPVKITELIEAVKKVQFEVANEISYENIKALLNNLSVQNSAGDSIAQAQRVNPKLLDFDGVAGFPVHRCEGNVLAGARRPDGAMKQPGRCAVLVGQQFGKSGGACGACGQRDGAGQV